MARLQKEKKDKKNEHSQVVSSFLWERTSNVSSVFPLGADENGLVRHKGRTSKASSSAAKDGRVKHGCVMARPPLIRDRRAKHP
nr:hypothetical protein CFP56_77741 [Quercus suber]